MCMLAVMRDRHMHLAQVNPCYLLALWLCIGIVRFLALPPTFETGKERFHAGIGCMGMQLVRGEQPLQMLLFQPDALVPDRPPEEHQRLRIEHAALMR